LVGTNIIYPLRQRFHDDDPAGKFKSGVVVGSGPLFFGGQFSSQISFAGTTRSKTRPAGLKGICMIFAFRLAGLCFKLFSFWF
jgi:hypothetical protein